VGRETLLRGLGQQRRVVRSAAKVPGSKGCQASFLTPWRPDLPISRLGVSKRTDIAMNSLVQLVQNGIFVAIAGHGLIGASLIWDKVLLQRRATQNLLSYVFWLGAISVFGLLLIPFGFRIPDAKFSGLAFLAGLLDLVATYFYYSALKAGEASEELAVMGGFTPLATALIALPLIKEPLGGELIGFVLLTLAGFVMFGAEKRPLKKMLPKILLAAVAFGLTAVLQRVVYDHTNFVSGFVFFTLGTFGGSVALLAPPAWRRQILQSSEEAAPKSRFWYMVNRFMAGVGSFLVLYAVSRTTPVLVNAIAGVRYAIIFVGAYAITRWRPSWFREDFRKPTLVTKAAGTCLVIAGLALIGLHGGRGGGGAAP
jgi:drug/metabolite transporter (DMT)-like permease